MAVAKLHLICGNCGCNDNFEYRHEYTPIDSEDEQTRAGTLLSCRNCSTLHQLDANAVNNNILDTVPVPRKLVCEINQMLLDAQIERHHDVWEIDNETITRVIGLFVTHIKEEWLN